MGTRAKEKPKWRTRCESCGKSFLAIRHSCRYCSGLCRHRAAVPLLPTPKKKRCEWCNALFQPTRADRRFCSDRCGFRTWTDNNRAKYNRKMRELNYKTRVRTPWLLLVRAAMHRSKKLGLPCDLTIEWGRNRWTGRCEVSNIPFLIQEKSPRTLFSPTVDRIDASKGYTQDNSRFVLWGVNAFKQNGTDAQMLDIAKGIVLTASRIDLSYVPDAPASSNQACACQIGLRSSAQR